MNEEKPANISDAKPTHDPQGSAAPRPVNPPPVTVWPFVVSVGLGICFWGVTLNLFVVCVGVGVFLVGMAGLIGDWIREQRNEST